MSKENNLIELFDLNYRSSISVVNYELYKMGMDFNGDLLNPDEIVIKDEQIRIRFTYPLSAKVEIEFQNKGGFSEKDLFRYIYKGYTKIYDEENQDIGRFDNISKGLNRPETQGRYGIWGHELGDLFIEEVWYNSRVKIVSLIVGS
ncbi:MAG: hypothetical protein ACFFBP_21935 [Promethearchaeota archaeon]